MNKRNKVKTLNRSADHRKSMIDNMITSLFLHERIESTHARVRVVRSFAEKMITRAKRNLAAEATPEQKLHNRREIMKDINNTLVVDKLFEDIAKRFEERNGGYTRIYKLVNRSSDNSEMSLLELVVKRDREELKEEARGKRKVKKSPSTATDSKKDKKEKKS